MYVGTGCIFRREHHCWLGTRKDNARIDSAAKALCNKFKKDVFVRRNQIDTSLSTGRA
ncbi:hypothetical protein ISN45_Aa06g002500 [Arabidopsis thaliana x Arabidopsis arenosa]|uniref:Uncharacterized protein n=1 Tax=Arabidopsis thaliana x Arabidopsis arenosa TaxID=1240361 RepID=A0A8T1YSK9_9BRAS|nr:hypothetical protein ISN45_Aa06g002500 [Arabidopsis thaliana x Arabidopsis arenosa]